MVTGIPGKVTDMFELRRYSVDHQHGDTEEYANQP